MYTPGKSKGYIRDSVFLHFKGAKNILTLPNLYFGLEKKLLESGANVECTEYSVNTFKAQTKIAPKEIILHKKNIKDLDLEKYDAIFMDFYGTFNKHIEEALPKIKSGTKIAITFLMARENKKLQERLNIKNREESYVSLLGEYGIVITKYASYNDTTPMCVFFGYKL